MSERLLERYPDLERRETTSSPNTSNPHFDLPDLALREAVPVLSRLVRDPDFLGSRVLPLLEDAKKAEDWYVAYRHEDLDRSYSLQVFVWPPRSATRIHDHSSWGAFCCVVGSVLEERFERVDIGMSRQDDIRFERIERFRQFGGRLDALDLGIVRVIA